jgi:hypothetical protein
LSARCAEAKEGARVPCRGARGTAKHRLLVLIRGLQVHVASHFAHVAGAGPAQQGAPRARPAHRGTHRDTNGSAVIVQPG